jgi:hypothetical protein
LTKNLNGRKLMSHQKNPRSPNVIGKKIISGTAAFGQVRTVSQNLKVAGPQKRAILAVKTHRNHPSEKNQVVIISK